MPEQVETQWEKLLQWFTEYHARFAPYFFRHEVRERSGRYLQTLFSPLERKNGWQIAEAMGERTPGGAQKLLNQAIWDEEAVRDELEQFVAEQFGDAEEGIFVLDESGFPKKGGKSVGVQRQYCGAVGKIENSPGRRVPQLRLAERPHLSGPPAVSAAERVGRGCRPAPGGGRTGRGRLSDQSRTGPLDAGAYLASGGAGPLGDRR